MGEQQGSAKDRAEHAGVGLDEAIAGLREQLASAHSRAADSDIQFPVESLTVELKVAVTRLVGGKAGFRVPFVGAEIGGEGSRQSDAVQTVTLVLGGPIDRDGRPQRVASASDEEKE